MGPTSRSLAWSAALGSSGTAGTPLAAWGLSCSSGPQWRGFRNLYLADIAGICIPLGYAIGRIGCQVSGDGDYGTASQSAGGRWCTGTARSRRRPRSTPRRSTTYLRDGHPGAGAVAPARPRAPRGDLRPCTSCSEVWSGSSWSHPPQRRPVRRAHAAQLWSVAMMIGLVAWTAVVARRDGLGAGVSLRCRRRRCGPTAARSRPGPGRPRSTATAGSKAIP